MWQKIYITLITKVCFITMIIIPFVNKAFSQHETHTLLAIQNIYFLLFTGVYILAEICHNAKSTWCRNCPWDNSICWYLTTYTQYMTRGQRLTSKVEASPGYSLEWVGRWPTLPAQLESKVYCKKGSTNFHKSDKTWEPS